MGHKLDHIMYEISVLYIALPVFIFLSGWLRLAAAIPVCGVFLISLFRFLKNKPEPVDWHLSNKQLGVVLASVLLLAIWVFFSGQGGFSFQNSDFITRNAIFHDLIEKPWPVIYDYSAQSGNMSIASSSDSTILTYYIAFWLPGALVGKVFGWYAANTFLYFWTLLGVVLITYFLFRTLRNASIWSVVILMFFSGLDILGYLFLSRGKIPGMTAHIEWWSGLQYSSNTTLLFWVFNQTVAIWLAILLILNMKNSRSLFFLYAVLLLHGPFPFVGMLPIVLWKAYKGYPLSLPLKNAGELSGMRKNGIITFFLWFWDGVRRALTFENTAGGISVLVIVYLYLTNNISSASTGTNSIFTNYYIFILFEAGLYLVVLFADHCRKPLYWICLGSLLAIPFFRIGSSQDFCMRVSIPALFMVQILIQQTLLGKSGMPAVLPARQKEETDISEAETYATMAATETSEEETDTPNERMLEDVVKDTSGQGKRLIRVILVIFLVIGSVVPLQEISRSVVYTLPAYSITKSAMISVGDALRSSENTVLISAGQSILRQSQFGFTWADSLKTLGKEKGNSRNFIGPVEDNLFYEYLARH